MDNNNTTNIMPFGDCSFEITTGNEIMLKALTKYAMMLDFITNSQADEQLNVDGLINSILADGMTKRIKELVKKHGFENTDDFISNMLNCHDGEEVNIIVKDQELKFYHKLHDEILSYIPIDNKQKTLPI